MDKKQNSIIRMGSSVSGVLDSNSEFIETIPTLKEAKDLLDELLSETDRHLLGQLDTGKEVTEQKTGSKGGLRTSFRKVSNALVAYSVITTDAAEKSLGVKHTYSDSDIKRLPDKELFGRAYILFGDAKPLAAKLVPFVTAAEIDLLKTEADDFNMLLTKKRTKVINSSVATKNLAEAVGKIVDLLNDVVDKIVEGLRFTQVDLYKAYKNARVIIDPPYRKSKKAKASK